MVKKLLKYEFDAYIRTLLPIQGILLVIATVGRLIALLKVDHFSYHIVNFFSVMAFVVSNIVLGGFTVIFVIIRFYKNMFSTEGYLTMTLPVTPSQHLITKLLTAITFTALSAISMYLSWGIAIIGEDLNRYFERLGSFYTELFRNCHVHAAFYILEVLILVIVYVACFYMQFYACMSIGQLAKKHRILASFGAYFGFYILSQILGAMSIVLFIQLAIDGALDGIAEMLISFGEAQYHFYFLFFIVVCLAITSFFYYITYKIIKDKLNLE